MDKSIEDKGVPMNFSLAGPFFTGSCAIAASNARIKMWVKASRVLIFSDRQWVTSCVRNNPHRM